MVSSTFLKTSGPREFSLANTWRELSGMNEYRCGVALPSMMRSEATFFRLGIADSAVGE
jgi:hypothetical protein